MILTILGVFGALLLWYLVSAERINVDDALRRDVPGKTIQLTAGTTYYQEHGEVGRQVVVLIPGATLSTWVWHGLAEQIAAAGYHVISYDLFGRGYSDRPDQVYDLNFHYDQLQELLEELAPAQQVHFVSLAFGTLIAGEYIRQQPSRAGKLLAIGPDGFGVEMSAASQSLMFRTPYVKNFLFTVFGNRILLGRLPDYSKDPAVLSELRENYSAELAWKGFKRAVLSSVENMPIHDARELYRDVSDVNDDIMLLWGDLDYVTPMPGMHIIQEAFPNAEVEVIEGAGHLPHWDDPDKTLQLMLKFLDDKER